MNIAQQDEMNRELVDINKRLNKLERTIEKFTATRAIHMDAVGTAKPYVIQFVPPATDVSPDSTGA